MLSGSVWGGHDVARLVVAGRGASDKRPSGDWDHQSLCLSCSLTDLPAELFVQTLSMNCIMIYCPFGGFSSHRVPASYRPLYLPSIIQFWETPISNALDKPIWKTLTCVKSPTSLPTGNTGLLSPLPRHTLHVISLAATGTCCRAQKWSQQRCCHVNNHYLSMGIWSTCDVLSPLMVKNCVLCHHWWSGNI